MRPRGGWATCALARRPPPSAAMPLRLLLPALAAGLLLVPAAASAQEPGDPAVLGQASARLSGALVVDFRSDPATCAAVGRCGLEGTLAWRPAGRLTLVPGRTRDRVLAPLLPTDERQDGMTRTTAQVRRAGTATCTDAVDGFSDLALAGRRGGRLTLRLGESTDPLATRCGGPLLADVAEGLPAPGVTLATLRRGPATLDAAGEAPFTAAGLTGTLRSTLRIRLGRLRSGSPFEEDRAGAGERRRVIRARYRVQDVRGTLTAPFTASSTRALCAPLDACGVTGELVVAPDARRGSAEVQASLPVRSTVRGLVPALRRARGDFADERAIQGLGFVEWSDRGTVRATVARPGGAPPCTDEAPLRAGALFLEPRGARVRVTYLSTTPTRTRCAGPLLGVALGQPPAATGTVPVEAFARRRVALRLSRGARLEDGPYRATTRSDVVVVLRRTSLSTRVVREPGA